MFCSIKELAGYRLRALDGEMALARELCFDERHWTVRQLVADGSGPLAGRRLHIPPRAISRIDTTHRRIDVALTRRQLEAAAANHTPHLPAGNPGTELAATDDPYTLDTLPAAGEPLIVPPRSAAFPGGAASAAGGFGGARLHGSAAVIGSQVMAPDGGVGAIDDLLLDTGTWRIAYAVVDTHRWLPDRLVQLATASISSIDWREHQVRVKVGRATVKASPPYKHTNPVPPAGPQRLPHDDSRPAGTDGWHRLFSTSD